MPRFEAGCICHTLMDHADADEDDRGLLPMRVRFTWQPKEWHEAVRLVAAAPRSRRDVPFMVYGILGITCLGGVGDLLQFLEARHIEHAGSLLVMGSAFTAVAGSGAVWLTRTGLRRRKAKFLPPVPEGEQEVSFKESGWNAGVSTAEAITLRPWSRLNSVRTGTHTIVMLGSSSGTFTAVPLRALSADETGYLNRLLARKLRPSLKDGPAPAIAAARS